VNTTSSNIPTSILRPGRLISITMRELYANMKVRFSSPRLIKLGVWSIKYSHLFKNQLLVV